MVMRTTRIFLAVQAAVFLFAALLHRGILLTGYEHRQAVIAESTIGLVLLAGLVASFVLPQRTRGVAIAVQAFALLGTCVGLFTIIVGVGPQTRADLVVHGVMIALLIAGLRVATRRC